MNAIALGIASLSFCIWVGLLTVWGGFWKCDQRLESPRDEPLDSASLPVVCVVIPARNEAEMVPAMVRSLLNQDYSGKFHLILVDDHSTDGTADIARQTATSLGKADGLTVIAAEPLPAGWSGKLWAVEQGVRHAASLVPTPDYLLLTDADIQHDRSNLRQLIHKASQEDLDLVSLMVLLRCESFWEKLLIPAFIFFFQKLYPFPLVNQPDRKMAAAAGGCILVRRISLEQIGGIETVKQALIDDCALAIALKRPPHHPPSTGRIWLGLTQTTLSLRPYDSLQTIWDMVARSAYTQLNYSPWLLVGALVGMVLVYLVAPIVLLLGLLTVQTSLALIGGATWLLMALAYLPTLRLYRLSPLWSVCLPLIGFLYSLMTLDSALRHWQGRGGAWKGRVYP